MTEEAASPLFHSSLTLRVGVRRTIVARIIGTNTGRAGVPILRGQSLSSHLVEQDSCGDGCVERTDLAAHRDAERLVAPCE